MMNRLLNYLCFKWPFYFLPSLGLRRSRIKAFIRLQFIQSVYLNIDTSNSPLYDTIIHKAGGSINAPCKVPFCRKECPVLPEDVEVFRASGDVVCECGHCLREHPTYSYPTGMSHVYKGCDGVFYHL